MRARMSRRGATSKKTGGTHERDRSSGSRANRLGRSDTPKPSGDDPPSPAEIALRLRARLLERGEEISRRTPRRIQAYRRAWAEQRINDAQSDWANERDIDARISQGDPVAISDAFRDAAEVLMELADAWEREIGLS